MKFIYFLVFIFCIVYLSIPAYAIYLLYKLSHKSDIDDEDAE